MRFGYVLLGLVTLANIQPSSGQQCSNGLAGVQQDLVCCDADCGACGGSGCGQRPGGKSNCCTGRIMNSGVRCSNTQAAPCVIDDGPICITNGLPGVQRGSVCCEALCGTCGGAGCKGRPGGQDACCTGAIKDSGAMCSITSAAPCIIDDEVTCSNGVHGIESDGSCCASECGRCGGPNCDELPGGQDSCCTIIIQSTGVHCSDTPVAPCVLYDPYDD